ncbi:MAG: UbiA family prenyltransferase [Rudaea sp.]
MTPRTRKAAAVPLASVERRSGASAQAVLRLMRPHHWVKNLLLFVPLMTAHRLADAGALLAEVRAIVAVCLASSAVYALNDLVDLAADRTHPTKRTRPLASGAVKASLALPIAVVLMLAAALVAAPLPAVFAAALGAYVAGAVAYSLWLKRMRAVDVVVLGGLYALRMQLGAAAIGVPASAWLLSFAVCLFLSLALLKRYVELDAAARDGRDVGRSRGYRVPDRRAILGAGAASGALAVGVLGLYPFGPEAALYYRSPLALVALAPLVALWLVRAWRVALRGAMHDDPILFALRDVPSYGVLVALVVATEAAALLPRAA